MRPPALSSLLVVALIWGLPVGRVRSESATPVARPAFEGAAYAPRPGASAPGVEALTALGRALFFDASLSASGRVACASCHDPRHAFGPPNALAVQPPGDPAVAPAFRAAPSLRYLQTLPAFTEHAFDNDGDDSVDKGPTGGYGWDGRSGSAHAQARLPLFSASEMANRSPADLAARLRRAPTAGPMQAAFGADVFDDAERAVDAAAMALEVFQQSPAEFFPYSSRYDEVLRGRGVLSAAEARGRALFEDESKGSCAACHPSRPTPDGAFPLFTDHGHLALGVPRNRSLRANADPGFFDLGLCGPLRTDLAKVAEDCGRFRTPGLRNVALRQVFFHNGVVRSLTDAVRFYAERDRAPARWYGPAGRFDDLPARYHANVDTEPPFGRRDGAPPALTAQEVADVVAFLGTLTDADQLPGAKP